MRTYAEEGTLPAGMEHFFRTRLRPDSAVRTLPDGGGEIHEARMAWSRNSWDRFAWPAGYGLACWQQNYDVYDSEFYTPPYRHATLRLQSFNGMPAPSVEPGIGASAAARAYGSAPLEPGMEWTYRGLRQLVERDGPNSPHRVIRDSITRALRVEAVEGSGAGARYRVECRDRLHARSLDGTPRSDSSASAAIEVGRGHPDSLVSLPRLGGTFADLRQFWNFDGYPEETLAEAAGPQGPLRVAVVAAREPALFSDIMVYAQGIGFLSRSKTLSGVMGLVERRDWRLVEFMGRPFGLPASLPVHPARHARWRVGGTAHPLLLRGRDLRGRHQGVPESVPEAAIPRR